MCGPWKQEFKRSSAEYLFKQRTSLILHTHELISKDSQTKKEVKDGQEGHVSFNNNQFEAVNYLFSSIIKKLTFYMKSHGP